MNRTFKKVHLSVYNVLIGSADVTISDSENPKLVIHMTNEDFKNYILDRTSKFEVAYNEFSEPLEVKLILKSKGLKR